jgi:methylenetetrahydrofolate dehydrogenase (NADP+)/methenyltetrahydrofolate cyclohydrolase
LDRIALAKDADGVTSLGFGRMALQQPAFGSATPAGLMALAREFPVPLESKHAAVAGRSPLLGKPMAQRRLNANATVANRHSQTGQRPASARRADIVVGAVGHPRFIRNDRIKNGAGVVDAGCHTAGIGDIGDIALDDVARFSAFTPASGGVVPMAIAPSMAQAVMAAEAVAAA